MCIYKKYIYVFSPVCIKTIQHLTRRLQQKKNQSFDLHTCAYWLNGKKMNEYIHNRLIGEKIHISLIGSYCGSENVLHSGSVCLILLYTLIPRKERYRWLRKQQRNHRLNHETAWRFFFLLLLFVKRKLVVQEEGSGGEFCTNCEKVETSRL